MICLLKVVFHKFYLVHSWILRPKLKGKIAKIKVNNGNNLFSDKKSLNDQVLRITSFCKEQ